MLFDWDFGVDGYGLFEVVVDVIWYCNGSVLIFLLVDCSVVLLVLVVVMGKVDDFVWLFEDMVDFIGGCIYVVIECYCLIVLLLMFGVFVKFLCVYEYLWYMFGYMGGIGFLKLLVGCVFFEYFGELLFCLDLLILVGEFGLLFDYFGLIGESECYVVCVFGVYCMYYVMNGLLMLNCIILMVSVSCD